MKNDAQQEHLRVKAIAREEHLKMFPLLAAYLDIIREYNTRTTSINEMPTKPAGLTTMQATKAAMERVGRPARDFQDLQMAETWIRRLNDELEMLSPEPDRDITDWVIHSLYPLAEHVPSAQDWDAMSIEDRDDLLDEIIQSIPDADKIDVFKETLAYAMRSVLAEITRQDQHHLRTA
jgi:hypothetical protein